MKRQVHKGGKDAKIGFLDLSCHNDPSRPQAKDEDSQAFFSLPFSTKTLISQNTLTDFDQRFVSFSTLEPVCMATILQKPKQAHVSFSIQLIMKLLKNEYCIPVETVLCNNMRCILKPHREIIFVYNLHLNQTLLKLK